MEAFTSRPHRSAVSPLFLTATLRITMLHYTSKATIRAEAFSIVVLKPAIFAVVKSIPTAHLAFSHYLPFLIL